MTWYSTTASPVVRLNQLNPLSRGDSTRHPEHTRPIDNGHLADRLGYDRPSKAIDWLINKATNAIAKLDELPE
ncbi:hypothetical protein RJ639_028405 [Escallonia herrerae]|uniref:TCP domain-containing protein n=1 Tax=Escallonia herrerae TaxID=1293975 RepID=A0AA89BFA9_9ASTE|nr:hypothetical protein RJ639_028405 [Escallonia herrerae]